jgi:hypothetical protein
MTLTLKQRTTPVTGAAQVVAALALTPEARSVLAAELRNALCGASVAAGAITDAEQRELVRLTIDRVLELVRELESQPDGNDGQ